MFDIIHDPDRPFLIDAGDRQVRVVGTEFNLRQRGETFALTVLRGVVHVRSAKASDATPTRVVAGQRLIHRRGVSKSAVSAAPPDAAIAWTRGRLVYRNATLREVAEDLSRSLGTPVRMADPATGRIRFTGVLMLDDKTAVLRRLEAFAALRAEPDREGVVLHRR